jgi:hypothetical protein
MTMATDYYLNPRSLPSPLGTRGWTSPPLIVSTLCQKVTMRSSVQLLGKIRNLVSGVLPESAALSFLSWSAQYFPNSSRLRNISGRACVSSNIYTIISLCCLVKEHVCLTTLHLLPLDNIDHFIRDSNPLVSSPRPR